MKEKRMCEKSRKNGNYKTSIMIPEEIYKVLLKKGNTEYRSVNSIIIFILKNHLEKEGVL